MFYQHAPSTKFNLLLIIFKNLHSTKVPTNLLAFIVTTPKYVKARLYYFL